MPGDPYRYERRIQHATTCEVCGREIVKNAEAMTWREEINWFRGDDVMHARHVKCHRKATADAQ